MDGLYTRLTWFAVTVENDIGLIAVHYVQAVFASGAMKQEEARGLTVLRVEKWSGRR